MTKPLILLVAALSMPAVGWHLEHGGNRISLTDW
jgi:hypothetical protein